MIKRAVINFEKKNHYFLVGLVNVGDVIREVNGDPVGKDLEKAQEKLVCMQVLMECSCKVAACLQNMIPGIYF